MKKKVIVALLAAMALSVTACGDNTSEKKETTEETVGSADTEEKVAKTNATDWSYYYTDIDTSVDTDNKVENPLIDNEYVTIGDYKNLVIEKVTVQEVTDEVVENKLQEAMKSYTEREVEVTDRDTIQKGDIADINYVGTKDGEAFDGGSAEGYKLEIGSGTFIDGFEDGLIGVKKGETVNLPLTFPENYTSEDLAGKKVNFEVTVNGIYTKETEELTDELVKENTEYDSMEAYKAVIADELTAQNQSSAESQKQQEIWTALSSICNVKKYDEAQMKEYIIDYLEYQEKMISTYYNGQTLDEYLESTEATKEDLKDTAVTYAKNMLMQKMYFNAIAEEEGLECTDEAFDKYVKQCMEEAGYEEEDKFWAYLEEQGYVLDEIKQTFRDNIQAQNVMQNLMDNVKEEETAEEEETKETEEKKTETKEAETDETETKETETKETAE